MLNRTSPGPRHRRLSFYLRCPLGLKLQGGGTLLVLLEEAAIPSPGLSLHCPHKVSCRVPWDKVALWAKLDPDLK